MSFENDKLVQLLAHKFTTT